MDAIALTAQDDSDFGAWFRERVREINGIELDPSQPLPGAVAVTLEGQA